MDSETVNTDDVKTKLKMGLITIHGAYVTHKGEISTDKFLEGKTNEFFYLDDLDYGFQTALLCKINNKYVVDRLVTSLHQIKESSMATWPIICIGHSNGCAILHEASYHKAFPTHMNISYLYINPCLEPNYIPSLHVKRVHVWYSEGDEVVQRAAKLKKYSFGLLCPSSWGNMGQTGCKSNSPRITNYNLNNYHTLILKYPFSLDHSDVFIPDIFEKIQPIMLEEIKKKLTGDLR